MATIIMIPVKLGIPRFKASYSLLVLDEFTFKAGVVQESSFIQIGLVPGMRRERSIVIFLILPFIPYHFTINSTTRVLILSYSLIKVLVGQPYRLQEHFYWACDGSASPLRIFGEPRLPVTPGQIHTGKDFMGSWMLDDH